LSRLLSYIRRLALSPAFRRLTQVRILLRASFALRASLVREWPTFALRELFARRMVGCYRVRESGVKVCVRHTTHDVMGLDEVFSQHLYALPPPVSASLERDRPLVVVDLGANVGHFGAYVIGLFPDVRMTGFEPDNGNVRLLSRCIEANGREQSWTLVKACASTSDGSLRFVGSRGATSHVPAPGEEHPSATTVTALDVFPYLEGVDFLKIDIEGGEWPILGDPRFASVPASAVVLEYHPHLCPGDDARGQAFLLLEKAGYTVAPISHRPDGIGMLWGWRSASARS
jgi:FkbM family methyltransferase